MLRQRINRISFVGLGLIGTSLMQALKRAAAVEGRSIETIGFDPGFAEKDVATITGTLGLDCFETDPAKLYDADLVVLCAPVVTNIALLEVVKQYAPEGTLVTDVSSTKTEIALKARQLDLNFIGMHPIAGREQQGYRAASPELLEGRIIIICSDSGLTETSVLVDLCSLLRKAGCRPVIMSPEEHDRVYANISHLPQLVSTALMHHCRQNVESSGPGFASVSRLAGSPWLIWRDIVDTNRNNIATELETFSSLLATVAEEVRTGNSEALEAKFLEANRLYQLLQERDRP
ncbi:MAG: prephenate dehydrogenase [Chlorobiaceae bacterium]|nr:prephenate dehydrogenase [Chlorobiaceae bacterium]